VRRRVLANADNLLQSLLRHIVPCSLIRVPFRRSRGWLWWWWHLWCMGRATCDVNQYDWLHSPAGCIIPAAAVVYVDIGLSARTHSNCSSRVDKLPDSALDSVLLGFYSLHSIGVYGRPVSVFPVVDECWHMVDQKSEPIFFTLMVLMTKNMRAKHGFINILRYSWTIVLNHIVFTFYCYNIKYSPYTRLAETETIHCSLL